MVSNGKSDTLLWLHNKLDSNDAWTDSSICVQLDGETLRNIKDCFIDIDTKVKLKLLLLFFYFTDRKWHAELEELLVLAVHDSNQWVSVIAECMSMFISSGSISTDFQLENNRLICNEFVNSLDKSIKNDRRKIPLEWCYLNRRVLDSISDLQQDSAEKHFLLKREPKAEELKRHLLQKSVQTTRVKRKLSTLQTTKKICCFQSIYSDGCRLLSINNYLIKNTVKKDGIKLLNFDEQPMTVKNKRLQKIEVAHTLVSAPQNTVPDYAAGLSQTK